MKESGALVEEAAILPPDLAATGVRPVFVEAGRITSPSAHLVQFYERDELLEAAVARFLVGGLSARDVVTVIATEAHRHGFRARLIPLRESERDAIADLRDTAARTSRGGMMVSRNGRGRPGSEVGPSPIEMGDS